MLVDQIGAELLAHLIACGTCSRIFVAQQHSIGDLGCVEGRRIISQSKVKWQERRSNLALRHLADQTLEDYLFDRLTFDEREALEHHTGCCSQCAQELRRRETLVALIRAGLSERRTAKNTSSTANGVVQVQVAHCGVSVCFNNKLGSR